MNAILKAVLKAKDGSHGPKLRDAETRYHLAKRAFGFDSIETQTAWNYWHALKRDVAKNRLAQA